MSAEKPIDRSPGGAAETEIRILSASLEQRVIEMRKRGTRVLVIGVLLLGALYILLAGGMRWVARQVEHPKLVANTLEQKLVERLPFVGEQIERQLLGSARKQTKAVMRELERSLPRARKELEGDASALCDLVLADFENALPGLIEEVAVQESATLQPILEDLENPEGSEKLTAFFAERIRPVLAGIFDKPRYGSFDTLLALHGKLRSLSDRDNLSPEELIERELLAVVARSINTATK